MILLDSAHIDSLSLAIPFQRCQIIDSNFTSRVLTYYYDTEKFDEELQNSKPAVFTFNGITIRFRIAERLDNKTLNKFVIVTLSSKMLKHRYFEGITKHNIKLLYKEIISLNLIYVEYDDFLESKVSDVDICTNYRIDELTFLNSNKKLISLAQNGKDRFFNLFQKKNNKDQFINLGLDINSRPKAKPSTPYIKNYFKTVELTTKSLDFYEYYLKDHLYKTNQSIRNLARIEYTIKGYKHKQRLVKKKLLKHSYNTLFELLQVPTKELKRIIYSGFSEYLNFDKLEQTKKDLTGLSPTDALIVNLMEQLILSGKEKIDLYDILKNYTHNRTQKSRLKSKIDKLYKYLMTNNELLINKQKQNEEVQNFINKIRRNQ